MRVFHSRGFPPRQGGIFLASVVKEAKERMAEIHSDAFLAELATTNVNEKGTEISVLVRDQNGCLQSRQRLLHQLGDISRTVPEHATTGGKCERLWNEATRSESEQTNTQTNKVGKRRNSHRESQRDGGCSTEQV